MKVAEAAGASLRWALHAFGVVGAITVPAGEVGFAPLGD